MAIGGYGNVGKKVEASVVSGITSTAITIENFNAAIPSTEYSYILPANTKKYLIRTRQLSDMKLAYVLNDTVAGNYWTVRAGSVYTDDNFYSALTLYFQVSVAAVVEIISFT